MIVRRKHSFAPNFASIIEWIELNLAIENKHLEQRTSTTLLVFLGTAKVQVRDMKGLVAFVAFVTFVAPDFGTYE